MNEEIRRETADAFCELCDTAGFRKGNLIVIGGSSSEIRGGTIGKDSSYDIGTDVVETLIQEAGKRSLRLAFQCCEHLNRALVVERETAETYRLDEVSVVPWLHAGGAVATNAYAHFLHPTVVESIQAHGGMDKGITMIGMHLRRVAVPVRLKHNRIGKALVAAARTRPPLIGGERAHYADTQQPHCIK